MQCEMRFHVRVGTKGAAVLAAAPKSSAYFVISAMNTPKGSSVTSLPFALD
jgi:hypothetical protein